MKTDDELLEIPKFLKDLAIRDKKEGRSGKGLNNINKPPKFIMPNLPKSKKQIKKERNKNLMVYLETLLNVNLKKKPLIAKMRNKFPELSSAQICRFINNQLKLRVIEIDVTFKTKPCVIKGKYWRTL